MHTNPLLGLKQYQQSIWLDYIERRLLLDGTLQRLITEDGLSGMTSNPAIFEMAINGSHDYDDDIRRGANANRTAGQIYESLAIHDVQTAADLLRDSYDQTQGLDGYVSFEVSPLLAHDTDNTIDEARRLWQTLDRPNVMIKIPATKAGIPAVKTLISEGINVNVTLLFSVGRYVEALDAYMDGLEIRANKGDSISHVASVASFFLSRIDVMIDTKLDQLAAQGGAIAKVASALRGQVAVACAGFAYKRFLEHSARERWQQLEKAGARKQRPLWASTGTKDPAYSEIKYVEALIGPDTVNTLPIKTLDAYREHGNPDERLSQAMAQAPSVIRQLADVGIDLVEIDQALETEGIDKFIKPYEKLLATIDQRCKNVID